MYVDPVGPHEMYAAKLQALFPTLQFTVIPKADALFPVVSAASIVAKVTRDVFMQEWVFGPAQKELTLDEDFGSGYPSGGSIPARSSFFAAQLSSSVSRQIREP